MAKLTKWCDVRCEEENCSWYSDTLTLMEMKNVWSQYRMHKLLVHPEKVTKKQCADWKLEVQRATFLKEGLAKGEFLAKEEYGRFRGK